MTSGRPPLLISLALITTLMTLIISVISAASAHATVVLGDLTVVPEAPAPGEPFTLQVSLQDPTQVPVEDAYMFVELRPQEEPEAEPVRADFSETDTGGLYEATTSLPEAGAYRVRLRDQTYRQEETSATLESPLQVGASNDAQPFLFPPTAVSGANLRTWLLWILGLPIVAGVFVTALVLTRGDDKAKPQN